MKRLFLLFVLVLLLPQLSAQNPLPIEIIDGKYYYQNTKVGYGFIKSIVVDDPLAYMEVKKGNSRYIWGEILGGFGGAMLGMSAADLLAGTTRFSDDPKMGLLMGSLIAGSGVYLVIRGSARVRRGVDIYNANLSAMLDRKDWYLEFGITENGVGLCCRF